MIFDRFYHSGMEYFADEGDEKCRNTRKIVKIKFGDFGNEI